MNTPTLILTILTIVGFIWSIKLLFSLRRKAAKSGDRDIVVILTVTILALFVFAIIAVVSFANIYGIGRLPAYNQMRQGMPETYTPPEIVITPPTNGSTQPQSQPTFDEHKQRMDEIKKNGL